MSQPRKYVTRAVDAPLPKDAHINDADAKLMRLGLHPQNDEKVDEEIAKACEAIREARPRSPVGCHTEHFEVRSVSARPLDGRRPRGSHD